MRFGFGLGPSWMDARPRGPGAASARSAAGLRPPWRTQAGAEARGWSVKKDGMAKPSGAGRRDGICGVDGLALENFAGIAQPISSRLLEARDVVGAIEEIEAEAEP